MALGALLAAGPAHAVDRLVGPNSPYPSIQLAIDAAFDGDRVLIEEGWYNEALTVTAKEITLMPAVDGGSVTVASPYGGPYAHSVLWIDSGANVVVHGLVLNGNFQRRGALVELGSTASFVGVAFEAGVNADGFAGGSLDIWNNSTVTAEACSFGFGDAQTGLIPFGGNIGVEGGSHLELVDSAVSGGNALRGGGVWVDNTSTARVEASSFDNNQAVGVGDNDGGAIAAEAGSQLTVIDSTFAFNDAGTDSASAGGHVWSGGTLVVAGGSLETGNAYLGGAVAVEGGSLLISQALVTGNTGDKGGAIACKDSALCAVALADLTSNGGSLGGSMYTYASEVSVYESVFCENTASPGPVFVDVPGGAIYAAEGSLHVERNVFSGNTAEADGGAIAAESLDFSSVNNHYLLNTAGGWGGGVHVVDLLGLQPEADSTNDLFVLNAASFNGGIHFGVGLLNTVSYGWFDQNIPNAGDAVILWPTNTVGVDPLLDGWSGADPCNEATMVPGPGSPLIDGGDPALSDLDGSTSDIGAFGGIGLGDGGGTDPDGDGVIDFFDCSSLDPTIGLPSAWYPDLDNDGWGDDAQLLVDCTAPTGWISVGGDCDDTDPTVNPTQQWWLDSDGDGLGDPLASWYGCDPDPGWVDNGDDCDDEDATVGAPTLWYFDSDGDGWGGVDVLESCLQPPNGVEVGGDCAPDDPSIHPEAEEWCDGIDQDCDDAVDEDAVDAGVWFTDADGDGFGDPQTRTEGCEPPPDPVEDGTDCDDTDPFVYPGGKEIWYDGVDGDCDGASDFDQDRDGHELEVDCDDTDPERHPGLEEVFGDGVDQDCDGVDSRSWVAGGGCACDGSGGGSAAWWLPLLLGLGWRRR